MLADTLALANLYATIVSLGSASLVHLSSHNASFGTNNSIKRMCKLANLYSEPLVAFLVGPRYPQVGN